MAITCITCTADRPWAIARAEYQMARQSLQPDEWIVADAGKVPARLTQGQRHLRLPYHESGAASLANNLREAVRAAQGDYLVIIEDDDWYHPDYIEECRKRLRRISVAGEPWLRYYHVAERRYATFPNAGGSGLFQTSLRKKYVPALLRAIRQAQEGGGYDIDGRLWKMLSPAECRLFDDDLTVGIKGMPGSVGIGIGHRPIRLRRVHPRPSCPQGHLQPVDSRWAFDHDGQQLCSWIGDEANFYLAFSNGHDSDST